MQNSEFVISIIASAQRPHYRNYSVDISAIKTITPEEIKNIREKANLTQTVFANILNVSVSNTRKWEQGRRSPTGSTQVLLELLDKEPHALDYRMAS